MEQDAANRLLRDGDGVDAHVPEIGQRVLAPWLHARFPWKKIHYLVVRETEEDQDDHTVVVYVDWIDWSWIAGELG